MITLARAGIRSSYHGKRTMRCWMARAAGRLYVLIFAPNQSGAESGLGHEQPICDVRGMSACPSTLDIPLRRGER
jgi:hypothetical protein